MKQFVSFLFILSLLVGCGKNTPKPGVDSTAPAVPIWTLLTPGDTQVKLEWQANIEEDLDHYKLYWRAESGELSEVETLDKGATAFVVSSLSNGIPHFFALTAVDKNGNASAMSTEMIATPEALPDPPPPDEPEVGSFSVTTLETISIQKGQAKALPFAIARNNFEDEINFGLKSAPEGVSANLPQSTAEDNLLATLTVANEEGLAAGDYELEFEASAAGLSKTVAVNVKIEAKAVPEAPKPEVFSLQIKDNDSSRQLRQGHGEFVIGITGKHLEGITAAHLEKAVHAAITTLSTETIELGIEKHTDNEMTLVGSIPYGQTQGFYEVVFTTTKSVSANEAIIVTPITASPSGNDATGRGTPDAPFRSLSKAVSVAGPNDIIELEDGSYNLANGEQFPIDVSGKLIIGESSDGTILNGFGSASACLVTFGKGVELHNLTIRECGEAGIQASNGVSKLLNVDVTQNATHGMLVANSAKVTVLKSKFSDNQSSGIRAEDNAKLMFTGEEGSALYLNGESGILLLDNAQLEGHKLVATGNNTGLLVNGENTIVDLSDSDIFENIAFGVFVGNNQQTSLHQVRLEGNTSHGLVVLGNTNLDFIESKTYDNGHSGIHVFVDSGEVAALNVIDSVIDQNGGVEILFHSHDKDSTLFMRDSEIKDSGSKGLFLTGGSEFIDLGTIPNPGGNIISDSGDIYLFDARAANSGVVAAIGTNFIIGGVFYDETGVKLGASSLPPYWQIVNVGNTMSFGTPE